MMGWFGARAICRAGVAAQRNTAPGERRVLEQLNVIGLAPHALHPSLEALHAGDVVAALVRDVRIAIDRDVCDRVSLAEQEGVRGQVPVQGLQREIPTLAAVLPSLFIFLAERHTVAGGEAP